MLPLPMINFAAVLVAAIVGFIVGFIWYGPLFGKSWMKLINMTPKQLEKAKQKGMGKSMLAGFIAVLIMSFVLAHIIGWLQITTVFNGAQAGFWMWLGFIATTMLNSVLWEGKPGKLYGINVGHYLVALLIMGAVIVLMNPIKVF